MQPFGSQGPSTRPASSSQNGNANVSLRKPYLSIFLFAYTSITHNYCMAAAILMYRRRRCRTKLCTRTIMCHAYLQVRGKSGRNSTTKDLQTLSSVAVREETAKAVAGWLESQTLCNTNVSVWLRTVDGGLISPAAVYRRMISFGWRQCKYLHSKWIMPLSWRHPFRVLVKSELN